MKFETIEEGLKLANDTSYGLGSAVFTQDVRKAHQIARKLQAGQVWVNSSNDGAPSIPFGGYKNSGIGRELGEYAISVSLPLFMISRPDVCRTIVRRKLS